ncbi:MAG: glucose-6-phosphate isomerase [Phycisphaerales bacterium]|jgi:glucose-6-phosphate isomerase|nr:glucose-6-phosphate isomerase [Phycisphaerales bacterium]
MSHALDALSDHRDALNDVSLAALCDAPGRRDRFVHSLDGMTVDLSRHLATEETLGLLVALARERDVERLRDAMFAGEPVNTTEHRAALHVALRNQSDRPMLVDGVDVMPGVRDVLRRMQAFCAALHGGDWRGATGERITDVVNIGIGGSDLGPRMATEALRPWWTSGIRAHFVSNVDPSHLADTVASLDPARTLFIVASKTFGTQETLANAHAARSWIVDALGGDAVERHFVAVSTDAGRVAAFGIDTANMFEFWDWVGGRYSMWSAIGLSIAAAIGFDRFLDMLEGAHGMDAHFREAAPEQNVPMLLGLLDCWYRNCWGCQSRAVLPYDQHLSMLPAYLQQLEMESNGKRTRLDGTPTSKGTSMVVWGAPGTNGQHSFHQMLHQGTTLVPCDFLVAASSCEPSPDARGDMLIANCLAQAEALARGRSLEEVIEDGTPPELAPHKVMPGNRPSTTILYPRLDPKRLGALIAMYEHRVFTQGAVWGIDSFDQWGVELGKVLAGEILPGLTGEGPVSGDAVSRGLAAEVAAMRES